MGVLFIFNISSQMNMRSGVRTSGYTVCPCGEVMRVTGQEIGSLSSNVFERRTSTGSEVFSLLTCLDDIKFVFLSFFTVIEAI